MPRNEERHSPKGSFSTATSANMLRVEHAHRSEMDLPLCSNALEHVQRVRVGENTRNATALLVRRLPTYEKAAVERPSSQYRK